MPSQPPQEIRRHRPRGLPFANFSAIEEFSLDHLTANPLVPGRGLSPKCMPPTLTVVAEHDWMRDRAIAYSEELRRVNVDDPVLDYKDAVHEFATLDMLLKTPEAQACAEDIAIWVKNYISMSFRCELKFFFLQSSAMEQHLLKEHELENLIA